MTYTAGVHPQGYGADLLRLNISCYRRSLHRREIKDIIANHDISEPTFYDYVDALKKLYVIQDIEAWCPAICSKSSIQSSAKRELVDPSLVVAALGLKPEYFDTDLKTFGFVFETLCIRDLKVYSSAFGGHVSYYRDRYGLEADCVLHLKDGRYALIEIKLGAEGIESGAKHLCEIERLVKAYNETERQCPIRVPDLKIILTGTDFGYRRNDGVFVIPIGCLRD